MLLAFAATYFVIYTAVVEIYARIQREEVIEKAITRALEAEKRLQIVRLCGETPFRPNFMDIPGGIDYLLPGDTLGINTVVLDMFTLVTVDNHEALERVNPDDLFCVAYPFWSWSAYFGTQSIALKRPPFSHLIWTIPNPVRTFVEWVQNRTAIAQRFVP